MILQVVAVFTFFMMVVVFLSLHVTQKHVSWLWLGEEANGEYLHLLSFDLLARSVVGKVNNSKLWRRIFICNSFKEQELSCHSQSFILTFEGIQGCPVVGVNNLEVSLRANNDHPAALRNLQTSNVKVRGGFCWV
jgi:hypothetical protein